MPEKSLTLRSRAQHQAANYFDSGAFQSDLAKLVARPTESQVADSQSHLLAYLMQDIGPLLTELGFTTQIFDNPEPDSPPLLYGERIEDASLATVLTYGHGDVVHGQTGQWQTGLEPFCLTEIGDRLYGRGAADNKAQHLINLQALNAVIQSQNRLGFNVKVLIEMGEETGSPGLKLFCQKNADMLAADVLIASDGPRLRTDTPTIFTGARGGINFDLRVDLRDGAHHSGNFGGLLADPAMILAHALASITDSRGQILIPEWRPDSLTRRIREILATLPPHETGIALDEDWGECSLSPAERVFGWNSFAILAMTSGVPDSPVNAISGSARATCQLRFVVGTDARALLSNLRNHLDQRGFQQVAIVEHDQNTFPATRLDPDHPTVRYISRSLETSTGKAPHLLPNLGGSLPNDCFAETLGLPTVWIPHSYAGCSQHAPNEHILKPLSRQALILMAGLFADISEQGLPAV